MFSKYTCSETGKNLPNKEGENACSNIQMLDEMYNYINRELTEPSMQYN